MCEIAFLRIKLSSHSYRSGDDVEIDLLAQAADDIDELPVLTNKSKKGKKKKKDDDW